MKIEWVGTLLSSIPEAEKLADICESKTTLVYVANSRSTIAAKQWFSTSGSPPLSGMNDPFTGTIQGHWKTDMCTRTLYVSKEKANWTATHS